MNVITGTLICTLMSLTLFAQSTKESEAMIRSSRIASNEAIAKQNVAGIAKYWLSDFIQIRGNGSYLVGKDAITLLWEKSFRENPKVSYIRNPSEVIISKTDTLAWENGTWIGINSYSKGGKYAAMWKKRKGEWKLQSELFVVLD